MPVDNDDLLTGMSDKLFINGINGATGDYFQDPIAFADLKEMLTDQPRDSGTLNILRSSFQKVSQPHLGVPWDVDSEKVEEAGWGVVFHAQEDAAVTSAVMRLVEHRRAQIGNDQIVKVLDYRDGETMPRWLARHSVGVGTVNPERVPFYLLLVGSPARIPFLLGHLLDVEYAVGRIHFDTVDGYTKYVESVIAYETAAQAPTGKETVFFGPRHMSDPPTQLSARALLRPLALGQGDKKSVVERVAWRTKVAYTSRLIEPAASTKAALQSVFTPAADRPAPSLLFTASHGLPWPNGHELQAAAQGALLCADFPGPGLGAPKPAHYFTAADLPNEARLHGMVCFHFACFGIGTPQDDRFTHRQGQPPKQIAPAPFFSRLPQALLSHANGGALAVIGHVERAWEYSIVTDGAGPQIQPFETAIGSILSGKPIGLALKNFNERYAALSTSLGGMLEQLEFGMEVDTKALAKLWAERNDAEAYVVFGDPAVRVRKDVLQ